MIYFRQYKEKGSEPEEISEQAFNRYLKAWYKDISVFGVGVKIDTPFALFWKEK